MSEGPAKILLVDDDPQVASMIIDFVERTFQARVTHVCTASDAIERDQAERHDVILADPHLPDSDDLGLVRKLQSGGERDIILVTNRPSLRRAVEAMRLGVRDMLTKPFDMHELGASLDRAVAASRRRRRIQARHERIRRVSETIIKERRVLRQRVDLVCRDLVSAYRRLAEKFVERYHVHE
jgi:DNA-binding NtrC family response regulator